MIANTVPPEWQDVADELRQVFVKGEKALPVVSRRHFFFVAPDWRHVTGTMMAASGDLRGFVSERH